MYIWSRTARNQTAGLSKSLNIKKQYRFRIIVQYEDLCICVLYERSLQ